MGTEILLHLRVKKFRYDLSSYAEEESYPTIKMETELRHLRSTQL